MAPPMTERSPAARPQGPSWEKRLVVLLVVGVVVVIAYLFAVTVVPRWWAQRVGRVVDGSLTTGALYGLFIGFVFTFVPLLVLWAVIRMRRAGRSWKAWLLWIVAVLVLAIPNLMTLGIVIGTSDAAHDGDRILSVEATGFRTWSLVGVILAVVAFLALQYLVRTRGWFKDQNRRLRDDAAERAQSG